MVEFTKNSIKAVLESPMNDVHIMCRFMGVTYKTYCQRFRNNGWSFNQKCDLARLFFALTGKDLNVLKGKSDDR